MKNHKPLSSKLFLLSITLLFILSCSLFGTPDDEEPEASAVPVESASATPTPTTAPEVSGPDDTEDSRCKGLAGEIEIWVKVGPAAAVGLEPFAVGNAPFSVTSEVPPYSVQGGGPISYNDMLEEKWGTYEVSFEMDTTVEGTCSGEPGSESLNLTLEASGEQNVVVDADGFHGEYPWAGSHTFNLDFPLEDGASIEGEGYDFVLHLSQ